MKPSHASTSKERNAARQTHEGWASEQEIPTWPSCSFKSPITVTWFMNQVEKMKGERAIRFIRREVTYSLSVESISFIHESSLKGNDRELWTRAEKSNISNCRWVWNFLNVLSYFPASKWTITNIFHCVSEIIQRALSVVTMTTVCVVSHTDSNTLSSCMRWSVRQFPYQILQGVQNESELFKFPLTLSGRAAAADPAHLVKVR